MSETLQFLVRYGYEILFLWVFIEQIGLPLPAVPLLLAAGALASSGEMNLFLALVLSVLASLLTDLIWYGVGRKYGRRVLGRLCRISLEPDSCVRRTEDIFARYGGRTLLFAKFVPGLNTAAPPLAGIFEMRLTRFLGFDALGALLWAGSFLGLGYLFENQLASLAKVVSNLGIQLGSAALVGIAFYVGWKSLQRHRFLRDLQVARITPEELKQKMDSGQDLVVVDLRHRMEVEAEPETIPGSLPMPGTKTTQMERELPREKEIVLFCS